MLSILRSHRKRGIASELIRLAIQQMKLQGAQEVQQAFVTSQLSLI